ncbi:MAG: ferric reductase-like transmembrane domain-containing protein [Aestuariivirga sp.]|uniref:sulfite oxidase heme-binding subunit YedZ n=1 Tax=Aestuariivirga sp. TaxID=2650926 RepID=UPI0025C01513|nr:ferric reductase-like transmembrane domain-containing protein [Aestuariivirga sp.]MCA3562718.1 ferric reductase-like transmembrane domain-containing protein [Aestuariivirga sp.]
MSLPIDSRWPFRLLLAFPALAMLIQFAVLDSWSRLIGQSGEWAIRMLILTLAVSPLRTLMKQLRMGPYWPGWLLKRRRDLGMACFLYALLHLTVYLLRQWNIHVVLFDLGSAAYMLGWFGFATLLALAITSNDASVHRLGRWWKPLQRTVYLSAIAVFLHWYLIRQNHDGLWLHLIPLAVLEGYRVLHNFARPAGVKH